MSVENPCGNEDCDDCYPIPIWKISQHRIQHITYEREIKASTLEEALRIYNEGTAHPSSYDDHYGEVISEDPIVTEKLPLREQIKWTCWHNLPKET